MLEDHEHDKLHDEDKVIAAIERLKNNKAPGSDDLPAELFKNGGPELVKTLQHLVIDIWIEEKLPTAWQKTYVPHADQVIGRYQCGFKRGKSTIDQVFTLRQFLEKGREHKLQTHHFFIDFRNAYDSIDRKELYTAFEEMGIPKKLIRLCRMTMLTVNGMVNIQNDLSGEFDYGKGVLQGDALACLLFVLALEKAMRDAGIIPAGLYSTCLLYTSGLLHQYHCEVNPIE